MGAEEEAVEMPWKSTKKMMMTLSRFSRHLRLGDEIWERWKTKGKEEEKEEEREEEEERFPGAIVSILPSRSLASSTKTESSLSV